jgi:hypothetical protein
VVATRCSVSQDLQIAVGCGSPFSCFPGNPCIRPSSSYLVFFLTFTAHHLVLLELLDFLICSLSSPSLFRSSPPVALFLTAQLLLGQSFHPHTALPALRSWLHHIRSIRSLPVYSSHLNSPTIPRSFHHRQVITAFTTARAVHHKKPRGPATLPLSILFPLVDSPQKRFPVISVLSTTN